METVDDENSTNNEGLVELSEKTPQACSSFDEEEGNSIEEEVDRASVDEVMSSVDQKTEITSLDAVDAGEVPVSFESSFENSLNFDAGPLKADLQGNEASFDLLPLTEAALEERSSQPQIGPNDSQDTTRTGSTSSMRLESSELSLSSGSKMKLAFVKSDGKMSLRVKKNGSSSKGLDASNGSLENTTPKTKPKPKPKTASRHSADKSGAASRRSKLTPNGTKEKDKVKTLSAGTGKGNTPQKPIMDLRSILQKHEKKTPKPDLQQYEKVNFYGSMSAIPFLKKSPEEGKKNKIKKKSVKVSKKDGGEALAQQEKAKLPTKEEIVSSIEYDESQLELWKSMTALDSMHASANNRPQEMLPLRPGKRQEKKQEEDSPPKNSGVRAFSRPEDWLNRPEMKSPVKGYKPTVSKEDSKQESGVLVMEPEATAVL